MGRIVLKTARDRDQYVIWSTVVDDVVLGPGTREQVAQHLLTEAGSPYMPKSVEVLLARVDEYGSSDRIARFGWWDDDPLSAGQGDDGWYHLPRGRLADYADAIGRGDKAAASALLECWQRFDEENDAP